MLQIVDFAINIFRKKQIVKLYEFIERMGNKSLQVYVLSISLLSYYLPIAVRYFFPDFAGIVSGFTYGLVTFSIACGYSLILMGIVKLMERFNISRLFFGR